MFWGIYSSKSLGEQEECIFYCWTWVEYGLNHDFCEVWSRKSWEFAEYWVESGPNWGDLHRPAPSQKSQPNVTETIFVKGLRDPWQRCKIRRVKHPVTRDWRIEFNSTVYQGRYVHTFEHLAHSAHRRHNEWMCRAWTQGRHIPFRECARLGGMDQGQYIHTFEPPAHSAYGRGAAVSVNPRHIRAINWELIPLGGELHCHLIITSPNLLGLVLVNGFTLRFWSLWPWCHWTCCYLLSILFPSLIPPVNQRINFPCGSTTWLPRKSNTFWRVRELILLLWNISWLERSQSVIPCGNRSGFRDSPWSVAIGGIPVTAAATVLAANLASCYISLDALHMPSHK
jgi:hypothetical protein